MKTSIDFNEHLDAQARAFEIGKSVGIEQANQPKLCCGRQEQCTSPCVGRSEYFKKQRNELMAVIENTRVSPKGNTEYTIDNIDVNLMRSAVASVKNQIKAAT